MAPHQERVVVEKQELDSKIESLRSFIQTDVCLALPFDERNRLSRQFVVMREYSCILAERIAAF